MYSWLSTFADEEPGLFGGACNIVDKKKRRWVESTRCNMREATAIMSISPASGFLVIDSADLTASVDGVHSECSAVLPGGITVTINNTTATILSGTPKADIANVLSVVATL